MAESGVSTSWTHPLLGRASLDLRPDEIRLNATLRGDETIWVRDHRVFGTATLPAAAYFDLVLSAAARFGLDRTWNLRDVHFDQLLTVPDREELRIRITVRRSSSGRATFDVQSAASDPAATSVWRNHGGGTLTLEPGKIVRAQEPVARRHELYPDKLTGDDFYRQADDTAFGWGTTHRVVREIYRSETEFLCRLALVDGRCSCEGADWPDPTLLDGCLQVPALELSLNAGPEMVAVPQRVGGFFFRDSSPRSVWVYGHRISMNASQRTIDLTLVDDSGEVVAQLTGVAFQLVRRDAFSTAIEARRSADRAGGGGRDASGSETGLLRQLEQAQPASRQAMLVAFIDRNVVELLKISDPSQDELRKGFFAIGLDSLLAIELQFRLQKALDFQLPPSEGLKIETAAELARCLLQDILGMDAPAGAGLG